jgi:hypothetical protein
LDSIKLVAEAKERAKKKTREVERAPRVARIQAKPWSASVKKLVLGHKVRIGMTLEQVRESWGAPDNINRTITQHGVRQQWVYGLSSYLYFEVGLVTAIQD